MVVLQSLLTPPPNSKYEIYRKEARRSVRWLKSQPAAIVGVLAPAGYGKTSYLRQIHLETKAAGHAVAWLSLRDVELDANTLILHLSATLRASGIDVGIEIERISSPNLAVMQIQSAIEQSGETVILILDDIDVLEPRLANIIERLLSPALDNFRIAFSARRAPLVRLGKIATTGRYQPVPQNELLLSFADMHELFRKRFVTAPDVFLVGSQYRKTQGWPAVVQVLARNQSSRFPAPSRTGMASANGDLTAFIKEEVLTDCTEAELQLLRLVALVGAANPKLLNKIFSRMDEPPDIGELVAVNPVFEWTACGREITINPLLADYLVEEFKLSDLANFQDLSLQLADWHERIGQPDLAINELIDAGSFERAIQLLGKEGRRVTLDGVPDRCISWLERVPEKPDEPDSGLLMAEAWARIALYDLVRGAELIEQVRELSASAKDVGTALELCLADAFRYAMMDDFVTAFEVVKSGFSIRQSPESPFIHAGYSNFSAWHSISVGRFEEGRSELYRAARYGPEAQGHLAWVYGTLGIAKAFTLEGDMTAADAEYRRIVSVAEGRRGYASAVAASAVGPWLDVLYEMNRIDELQSLLIGRLDLIFRACLPGGLASGASAIAKALFLDNSSEDAVALLHRLEEVGSNRMLDRLRANALATQIWIALKQGRSGHIRLILDRLTSMTDKSVGLGGTGQAAVNFLAVISQGRVQARSNPARAVADLEEVLQTLRSSPWRRNQLAIMALLASAAWASGNSGRAVEVLAECLDLAAPLRIKRTIVDEIDDPALLEQDALRQALGAEGNTLREELVGIMRRAEVDATTQPAAAHLDSLTPPPDNGRSELLAFTGREREVLFLIERGLSVKHIARALDVSPDTAKFHLKNIYQKLGVHDRVAAIEAIRKMQLFE